MERQPHKFRFAEDILQRLARRAPVAKRVKRLLLFLRQRTMPVYTHSQRIFFQYAGQQIRGVHIRVRHVCLLKTGRRRTQRFANGHAEAPSFCSPCVGVSSSADTSSAVSCFGSGFFSFAP